MEKTLAEFVIWLLSAPVVPSDEEVYDKALQMGLYKPKTAQEKTECRRFSHTSGRDSCHCSVLGLSMGAPCASLTPAVYRAAGLEVI